MKTIKSISKIITIAFLFLAGTSCSLSPIEEFKEYAKCVRAAKYLGQKKAERIIIYKMAKFAEENQIPNNAMLMSEIGQKISDELELYKYNTQGQVQILLDVYNSSFCQEIHEQEELTETKILFD